MRRKRANVLQELTNVTALKDARTMMSFAMENATEEISSVEINALARNMELTRS